MANRQEEYDASTHTLWIECPDADGETLIPKDEIKKWIAALKKGSTPDGRELERVHYVFHDEDAAEYNHHALKFARLGTFVQDGGKRRPYGSDDSTSFDTKEDFGIS